MNFQLEHQTTTRSCLPQSATVTDVQSADVLETYPTSYSCQNGHINSAGKVRAYAIDLFFCLHKIPNSGLIVAIVCAHTHVRESLMLYRSKKPGSSSQNQESHWLLAAFCIYFFFFEIAAL
jgi:hypothetical protein